MQGAPMKGPEGFPDASFWIKWPWCWGGSLKPAAAPLPLRAPRAAGEPGRKGKMAALGISNPIFHLLCDLKQVSPCL